MTPDTIPDWPAARAHLRSLDGDEWDRESQRQDRIWVAEYSAEFVAYAVSRGWTAAEAATWPDETARAAIIEHGAMAPRDAARLDVHEAELESQNE